MNDKKPGRDLANLIFDLGCVVALATLFVGTAVRIVWGMFQ